MASSFQPFTNWHIVIGGYLQNEGEPNGMVRLWRWLHGQHTSPECRVEYRTWNDRIPPLAELIWLLRPVDVPPIVDLYGYSWGGMSAVLLARHLDRRGIGVRKLILSDPVYRHWYCFGQWRALVPWSKIRIPANVREVQWMRQTTNLPRGHDLIADDPRRTVIFPPGKVDAAHHYMDDALADWLIAGRSLLFD